MAYVASYVAYVTHHFCQALYYHRAQTLIDLDEDFKADTLNKTHLSIYVHEYLPSANTFKMASICFVHSGTSRSAVGKIFVTFCELRCK